MRYSAEGLLQLGPLGSTAFLPDSKCLVDDGRGRTPALRKCEDVARPAQRLWDFTQVSGLLGPRAAGPACGEAEGSGGCRARGLDQLLPRDPLTDVRGPASSHSQGRAGLFTALWLPLLASWGGALGRRDGV